MEEIMPGCIGTLVALCVATALPEGAALMRAPGTPWEALTCASAAVGSVLVERCGIAPDLGAAGSVTNALRSWDPGGAVTRLAPDGSARLGLFAIVVTASTLAGTLLFGAPLGSAVGLAAVPIVLAAGARSVGNRRARELEEAMPGSFKALAIALGSGCSLAQAMRFVGTHAREPVKTEFMRVGLSIDCGVPASEALDSLLERLRAPGLDMVALALKVSRRTGAPLGDLLVQASDLVGLRMQLKRQLDVKTAQARMSARMVAGMPVALIGALSLLSADFRTGIMRPAGAASIAVALALNAIAWMLISRIMKVRI
ncbi:MAG: type II secretion protein F [Coriobacteriaceae bacterium]|nr:type II secretion protein F [Coriobacteriaceae bacterium]